MTQLCCGNGVSVEMFNGKIAFRDVQSSPAGVVEHRVAWPLEDLEELIAWLECQRVCDCEED